MTTPVLLTVDQTAERLGLTRAGIYKIFRTDETFPKRVYVSPGAPRIREDQLAAWIEDRTEAAA